MTTQWGPPLAGEQMKALRDAGLPDDAQWTRERFIPAGGFKAEEIYYLPADHIAYTLLEKGWLEKPNVRLHFGSDKAPDDWGGGEVLYADGVTANISRGGHLSWRGDIIAYIAKAEDAIMDHLDSLLPPEDTVTEDDGFCEDCHGSGVILGKLCRPCNGLPETVTLAKMTPTEIKAKYPKGVQPLVVLQTLGLVKYEPTRSERFWQGKERNSLYRDESARALIDAALEFER